MCWSLLGLCSLFVRVWCNKTKSTDLREIHWDKTSKQMKSAVGMYTILLMWKGTHHVWGKEAICVSRTPMRSTRPVFRNWQFAHNASHWIAINVDMMSHRDECLHHDIVMSHGEGCLQTWKRRRNSVFADTSNFWLTVHFTRVW